MLTALDERTRGAEDADVLLAELEALWVAEPEPAAPRRPAWPYNRLVNALVWGWPAVLATVIFAAPPPAPAATYAGWVVVASAALVFGPLLAGLVAVGSPLAALGLSALLGGTGIAVGIACRATAHHTGAWWGIETALFAGLAAVSLGALALRLRA